jgi:hypothetical protein
VSGTQRQTVPTVLLDEARPDPAGVVQAALLDVLRTPAAVLLAPQQVALIVVALLLAPA